MRGFLFAVAVAALPASVAAQPAGAQAEILFQKGKELMAKNSFAEACAAFDASQRLEPSTATLMNLANCREKNEQIATAWGLFLQTERELRGKTDAASLQLIKVARDRAAKLAPLVSKLTIQIGDASKFDGLEIMRGTERVDAVAWNQPLPVDGGTYEIHARAPGRAPWSGSVTIGARSDHKTLEVPPLAAPRIEPVAPVETARPMGPSEPVDAPRGTSGLALPIAFGIGALALGGTAIGFELWGQALLDDAKAAPNNSTEQDDLWRSANKRHWAAQGLAIASVASAGAAVYFFLTREPGDAPVVTPTATASSVGLSVDLRW